jgi:hypothetical protein
MAISIQKSAFMAGLLALVVSVQKCHPFRGCRLAGWPHHVRSVVDAVLAEVLVGALLHIAGNLYAGFPEGVEKLGDSLAGRRCPVNVPASLVAAGVA